MEERATPTTADQRASVRESREVPVRILLEAQELEAASENVSEAGVLVTAETPLRVRLRLGGGAERAGRIVRLQPLGGGRVGLAVEFED